MRQKSLEQIFEALNRADVLYLVVGGLAVVVAHGYVRFTADLDLILDMDEGNLTKAMNAFDSMGYRPRAPVRIMEFVDSKTRDRWVREKGLTVFSLWSEQHPGTEIDIFVEPPISFEKAYRSSIRLEVGHQVEAAVIGIDDLISLKEKAGRPRDLEDIDKLRVLKREQTDG
ncbi:MAG: hypothetical protein JRK53_26340 [Deltaproteobacteria bacterium]|nr:hypothetical protein [Deltaproteobacteria bacterium]